VAPNVWQAIVEAMNEEQLLEKAIAIAVEAHQGQRDRNGVPYILHPVRVMCRLDDVTEKTVAILHDVVEDTDWTFKDLEEEGFPRAVLEALDSVTKRKGEAYEDFVKRSANNPLGRKVKLADLEDNMDLRRLQNITEEDKARLQKYLNAWKSLMGNKS
jgi:(p)ppGpp synthase/HD superfamily hydrolase